MPQTTKQSQRVFLNKEYLIKLERRASFLEELLRFIEDKYFGYLMEEVEEEENIPLSKAKKLLK